MSLIQNILPALLFQNFIFKSLILNQNQKMYQKAFEFLHKNMGGFGVIN